MNYYNAENQLKGRKEILKNKYGEDKGNNIIDLVENLYENNLKNYHIKYLDFLLSDNHFWDENSPSSEEDRIKEVYKEIFDDEFWFDLENGILTNDDYYEEVEKLINNNGDEHEDIIELFYIYLVVDLQKLFKKKYGEF